MTEPAAGVLVTLRRRAAAARPADLLLPVVLFWGYDALCSLRPHAEALGMAHARLLSEGVLAPLTSFERHVNDAAAGSPTLTQVTVHLYDLCHYSVTMAVIAWLFFLRPAAFPRYRRALWLMTAGALATFYLYPVAPLRFLPGFVDLVARVDGGKEVPGDPTMYAAVPSVHIAWAVWCALVVVGVATTRWRWLALGYPLLIAYVVIATGNHAVIDILSGALLAVVGVTVGATASRWGWPLSNRVRRARRLEAEPAARSR